MKQRDSAAHGLFRVVRETGLLVSAVRLRSRIIAFRSKFQINSTRLLKTTRASIPCRSADVWPAAITRHGAIGCANSQFAPAHVVSHAAGAAVGAAAAWRLAGAARPHIVLEGWLGDPRGWAAPRGARHGAHTAAACRHRGPAAAAEAAAARRRCYAGWRRRRRWRRARLRRGDASAAPDGVRRGAHGRRHLLMHLLLELDEHGAVLALRARRVAEGGEEARRQGKGRGGDGEGG